MATLHHIRIDIHPTAYRGVNESVLHRMSISVDADDLQYEHSVVMTEDDLTSRFDWIFESCARILKTKLKKEGKTDD